MVKVVCHTRYFGYLYSTYYFDYGGLNSDYFYLGQQRMGKRRWRYESLGQLLTHYNCTE